MVSKAREDLPEPLSPVMTTSLSRGISSVRFLRLCSRAPPILIKSFAIGREFLDQTIHDHSRKSAGRKAAIQVPRMRPAPLRKSAHAEVAQVSNLLYRRFPIGRAPNHKCLR